MKNFLITSHVEDVQGYQLWRVDAKNEKDAISKFEKGEGLFISDELEVMSLGSVEAEEINDELETESSEITRLREELREKTEVLEWYGESKNYEVIVGDDWAGGDDSSNIKEDEGAKARFVLQKFKQPITKEREL